MYHPLTSLKNYAVYLKKFALFIEANEYVIGDMTTMIPKSDFNDKTLACFFYDIGGVTEYKPHVK